MGGPNLRLLSALVNGGFPVVGASLRVARMESSIDTFSREKNIYAHEKYTALRWR
jgi:hypothetical protein